MRKVGIQKGFHFFLGAIFLIRMKKMDKGDDRGIRRR
jgi:hypothetical protein